MSFERVRDEVIPVSFMLLPEMKSDEAKAMLLAIGLQESGFAFRQQVGGPARGYWQFESGGGWRGVLTHPQTKDRATELLKNAGYTSDPGYEILAKDDVLACCFARLLLWTSPWGLPKRGEHERSWRYYLDLWRPGRPRRQTWDGFFDKAWGD